ncbi:hypothetical protein B0I35DRAFT_429917 [Stachybotrys elegans]|uniref:Uncharacterized protein n=1 Tax=Stachybotrys elegans TaxID=80388 RepID=A0A8K0WSZ5_9HYPO|nr:hypothetical protein B0I35DRAFT_429917 [Stachybotrys elegans]
MRPDLRPTSPSSPTSPLSLVLASLALISLPSLVHAQELDSRADNNPLNINWDPAPPPEEGPAISANALRDPSYLPAQIGAIVGAYAVSLVLVAFILLLLTKRRREHLSAGSDEAQFEKPAPRAPARQPYTPFTSEIENISVPNFSYPSPIKTDFNIPPTPTTPYIFPSPTSSVGAPGVDPLVDQRVVAADRVMAQQQLEDMYKYVMEHEEAKQKGVAFEPPTYPRDTQQRTSTSDASSSTATLTKKERTKPANLNLARANEEKTQSRTSSLFSALRSPKKKSTLKGVTISSPIMTPQSATFPRQEQQEMNTIPPRQYAPAPPPPVPTDQFPSFGARISHSAAGGAPLTPDMSPQSVQSIDERIGYQLGGGNYNHYRNMSQAPTEVDPESATSEVPLVGLPASPRGSRFPSLPASPKPGATFGRSSGGSGAPSAVRAGGALPLRAYEPVHGSPATSTQVKQTVFERKGPLSPTSARTPFTAGAVPYSPYQPFTPCVPMTPSLVTKEDRRRMRKLEPKTPTMEMVKSSDEVW